MEKGILRVTEKRRFIKVPGGEVKLRKQIPDLGIELDRAECEFEGNPAEWIRIIRTGQEFSAKAAIEAKNTMREAKAAFEKAYKELLIAQSRSGDSFSLNHVRVPHDTRSKVLLTHPDNFSLKLNRFARYDFKDNKEEEKGFTYFVSKGIKTRDHRVIVPEFNIKADFGDLFSAESPTLADRQIKMASKYLKNIITPVFQPDWRFVTGLGGHSVYETGITLHHVYGVPYIPASSIKGVLRSWIIFSKFDNSEKLALKDDLFCRVFGCPKESVLEEAYMGRIVFFDALPREAPTIEPDVMTSHYPKWYSGEKAPVDTDSPNPVIFLTVKKTSFQFILGSKAKPGEEEWDLATKTFWDDKSLGWWLENALSEHGIGAKTAVGYGYFSKA
jgi:CRISPR-associated protein Cmr6